MSINTAWSINTALQRVPATALGQAVDEAVLTVICTTSCASPAEEEDDEEEVVVV